MHQSLATLNNDEVARLILRQLWQLHSNSGVSHGRSLRSMLLESAIDIMSLPDMRDLDAFGREELLLEAAKRKESIPPRIKRVPSIKRVSKRTLVVLLLHELRTWYEKDAEEHQFPLDFESELLDAALRLLRLPRRFKKPSSWSVEKLLNESRERFRRSLRL